jgi:hypothetical protein
MWHMVHWIRALAAGLALAVVTHASMTIRWNTAPARAAAQTAVVSSVHGTHVVLRLQDGSLRAYSATPAQARMLRALVGSTIHFREQPR